MKRWFIGIGDWWLPTPFYSMEEQEPESLYGYSRPVINTGQWPRAEGISPAEMFNSLASGEEEVF